MRRKLNSTRKPLYRSKSPLLFKFCNDFEGKSLVQSDATGSNLNRTAQSRIGETVRELLHSRCLDRGWFARRLSSLQLCLRKSTSLLVLVVRWCSRLEPLSKVYSKEESKLKSLSYMQALASRFFFLLRRGGCIAADPVNTMKGDGVPVVF